MSNDDIDFLLDDDDTGNNNNTNDNPNSMNMKALSFENGDNNDDKQNHEESAFAGCVSDDEEEEEESLEESDDDENDEETKQKNDFHYKKLQNETDDGDWTEDDVKVLIAKVEQLRERFNKVASSLFAHPLIWVPVNGLIANEAKNIFAQQRQGSVYFNNGLAKVGHRIDTEIKLLTGNLTSGQFSRAKCNNLAFLEIFVRLLEVEKGITFICTTLPLRAKKVERTKLASSIDLDLVSRGGLRWIKIRGSSARNLEADAVVDFSESEEDHDDPSNETPSKKQQTKKKNNNNNEVDEDDDEDDGEKGQKKTSSGPPMTPFTQIIARISRCCHENSHSLRLPFGMKPEAYLVCSDAPTRRTLKVLHAAAPNVRCIDLVNDPAGIAMLTPSSLSKNHHQHQRKRNKHNTTNNSKRAANDDDDDDNNDDDHDDEKKSVPSSNLDYRVECINFDVTAMVAICSDITNSEDPKNILHPSIFPSNPVLQRQADAEREGQLCIENFLEPILVEFTKLKSKSSSSSNSSSSLSPKTEKMIVGTGLELVMSRPEHGDEFWKPLVQQLIEEQKAKSNNNNNNNAETKIDYDFLGLPPRNELRNPGSLFGVASKNASKNNNNNHLSFTSIPENWIAAKGAIEEFAWIVETISGPLEKARAVWFLHRLRYIDTDAQPGIHDRLRAAFEIGAAAGSTSAQAVKQRQLNVFSLGDATNSVTVSANKAFLQTAFECGQLLCCSTHPARALTERKRLGIDMVPDREQWRAGNQPRREQDKF